MLYRKKNASKSISLCIALMIEKTKLAISVTGNQNSIKLSWNFSESEINISNATLLKQNLQYHYRKYSSHNS